MSNQCRIDVKSMSNRALRREGRGGFEGGVRGGSVPNKPLTILGVFAGVERGKNSLVFWVLFLGLAYREEKKRTQPPTERKSFGELFSPQRKTFQAGGGYENPIKTRKATSTTEIFPLWAPFFSAKKSSALEQGGVWFLFPSA